MSVAARVIGDVLVVAFGASHDMPTEDSGSASLNGGHHLQLRKVQMPGMITAIGRPMGAEYVRDLQFGMGHWDPDLPGASLPAHQQIERAGHILDRLGRHLGIDRRRFQLGMAQQHLDHPNVGPALQQMCGEAVPQSMG